MIKLTRLNGEALILNAILIEQIQSLPDTTITLTTGRKLVVKESETIIVKETINFYRKIGLASMREPGEKHE
ncbi:flagellar FlbD family protein [Virgibacillus halophilus]|uniref:Flagellar FlbD family protein n=1 Tax=Tigheibacillus halophilus TaxID=361280 RepID=A0ABU5CBY3_9BACI|nr:flagellar FlbD family protein [Virgibacillus halophilus]